MLEHIPGVQRIVVVSPDTIPGQISEIINRESLSARGANILWLNELADLPNLSKSDVARALRVELGNPRLGWYVQQVLKLRAFELLEPFGVTGNYCLVLDADSCFHQCTPMIDDDGAALLGTLPGYHHTPYFHHITRLSKGQISKQREGISSVCHHMVLHRGVMSALERLVADAWGAEAPVTLWERFLLEVEPGKTNEGGASEFELIFNFALQHCPSLVRLRSLDWRDNLGQVVITSKVFLTNGGPRSSGMEPPRSVAALERVVELWQHEDTENSCFVKTSVGPEALRDLDATANGFSFSAFHARDIPVPVPLLWLIRRLRQNGSADAQLLVRMPGEQLIARLERTAPAGATVKKYAAIALHTKERFQSAPLLFALLSVLADAPELNDWAEAADYDPDSDELLALVEKGLL